MTPRAAQTDENLLVRRIKYWLFTAFVVAGAGFTANEYLNRLARAEDVTKIANRQDDLSNRVTRVEEMTRHVEEDYHFLREQLFRIADQVGADRVDPPKH